LTPRHDGWRHIQDAAVLELRDSTGRWLYEVDLARCRTSAEVLDWLVQVRNKRWATAAIVAGLIGALDDLLHLQATLCSGGHERGPIDVASTLEGVAQLQAWSGAKIP